MMHRVPLIADGAILDAHEAAFAHFEGHTREHLYDRPRTVCHLLVGGGRRWSATFKAFADYWGFEPRLCQPYRAQTKGNFLLGHWTFSAAGSSVMQRELFDS